MIDLRNQNVVQTLAFMGNESVDLIVTDPPYRTISGGSNGDTGGMIAANDGRIFKHNDLKARDYLPELYRVMKNPSHLYLMTNFLNLEMFLAELRATGFEIHNLLIWGKNTATPNQYFMKNVEYVIFARKGKAFRINDCGSMTYQLHKNPRNKSHPTEKPVSLVQGYVENSSQVGDFVFDPFMGSGSTGCACKASGRDFLGVEIDPKYYFNACLRMGILPV